MKLLLPLDDNKTTVCQAFGRAPLFMVYDVEAKSFECLENPAASAQGGAGVKAAQFVLDNKADVVITPRCGENAGEVFKEANIKVFKSQGYDALENVELYLKNQLQELTHFHAGYHGIK